jgi:hypothetical protein
MAYKTMVRSPKLKTGKSIEKLEGFLDEYMKEGTDQGWTLHKFNISDWMIFGYLVTMIWETND